MTDGWYFARDGQQIGPVSRGQLIAELRRSPFWQQEFVWRPGYPAWVEAGSVGELSADLMRSRPAPEVPLSGQRGRQYDRQDDRQDARQASRRTTSLRTTLMVYAGLALLGVVSAVIYFWLF